MHLIDMDNVAVPLIFKDIVGIGCTSCQAAHAKHAQHDISLESYIYFLFHVHLFSSAKVGKKNKKSKNTIYNLYVTTL